MRSSRQSCSARMSPARRRSARPSKPPCAHSAAAAARRGWHRSSATTPRPRPRACAGPCLWSASVSALPERPPAATEIAQKSTDCASRHRSVTPTFAGEMKWEPCTPGRIPGSSTRRDPRVPRRGSRRAHAIAADIDAGIMLGCANPIGPLRFADPGRPKHTAGSHGPCTLITPSPCRRRRRMTTAELLGRKTGPSAMTTGSMMHDQSEEQQLLRRTACQLAESKIAQWPPATRPGASPGKPWRRCPAAVCTPPTPQAP